MNDYRKLVVWQKALDLAVEVYNLSSKFPREEIYGLTSQIRRAAVSIPSNIAEGRMRGSEKEFRQFLLIACASGGELETQIELAKRLPQFQKADYSRVESLLGEVMRMLNKLINTVTAVRS